MESEVNKQDIALRPWKERKLMKSTNPVDKTQTPAPVALKPIPVRDPSRIHADSLRKGSLEWRLDYAVESGRIDLAEKISDFIGEGCSSPTGPPNKTIPMEVGEQTESRERLKFRRPVWLFQAKERWEAKSNM
ncbi:unnamed protein product [Heterobilharzia americana]|nr:unnamed protein product [Heterobilharzia americana]